ncbi:MAG: GNVR domain-containing protein [Nitrospirota bacterium]
MEQKELIEKQKKTGSLRDFMSILFKHKQKILVVFLATVITVTVGSFLIPPTYEAKSSLLVKFGREYIYQPEVGERPQDMRLIPLDQEEVINSEIQILTSRDLIEKVIRTLGIEKIYPELAKSPSKNIAPIEKAILQFKKKLFTEGIKKSNVIQVSFQHKEPQIAAQAVNLLVDFFKEKHLQVFSDPRSSFLEQQLVTYEQKLKESENNLESFKQRHRVSSLDEQRSLFLKQRTDLDTSLKNTQNQIKELQQKIASLENQMQTISESKTLYTETDRYKVIDEAKVKLLTLQLREQELLQNYNESNRLVVNVCKEIQLVKDYLLEQEEAIKGKVKTGNVVYQEAEKEIIKAKAELSSQEAKETSLKLQLAQLDRAIQNFDLREKELHNLRREQENNEKNYQTYLHKVEEARISDDMNRQKMANLSVIQAAAVPTKPIKPKKGLNIFLSVILGAVSGLGYAFFSEYTAQGLSTPEDAEKRLNLPVIVTISNKR